MPQRRVPRVVIRHEEMPLLTTPAKIDRGALVALNVAARSLPDLVVREIGPR